MEIEFEQNYAWSKKAAQQIAKVEARGYWVAALVFGAFALGGFATFLVANDGIAFLLIVSGISALFAVASAFYCVRVRKSWQRRLTQAFGLDNSPISCMLITDHEYIELRNMQTNTVTRHRGQDLDQITKTNDTILIRFATQDSFVLPRNADLEAAVDTWEYDIHI